MYLHIRMSLKAETQYRYTDKKNRHDTNYLCK